MRRKSNWNSTDMQTFEETFIFFVMAPTILINETPCPRSLKNNCAIYLPPFGYPNSLLSRQSSWQKAATDILLLCRLWCARWAVPHRTPANILSEVWWPDMTRVFSLKIYFLLTLFDMGSTPTDLTWGGGHMAPLPENDKYINQIDSIVTIVHILRSFFLSFSTCSDKIIPIHNNSFICTFF